MTVADSEGQVGKEIESGGTFPEKTVSRVTLAGNRSTESSFNQKRM